MKEDNDTRTIYGEDDAGEFRLDIPASYRLTYGPNVPYAKKENNYGGKVEGYSLRMYEGDKLIACLTNVKWFKDTTVRLSRVVERVTQQTVWKDDEGNYTQETTMNKTRQLVPPSVEVLSDKEKNNNNKGRK